MTGTITKRPRQKGKTGWGYSFFAGRTPEGKRIQITKSGFNTRKEAADALREAIRRNQQSESSTVPQDSTLATFFDEWLQQYAKHHCAPKTYERYVQLGKCALSHLGEIKIHQLTAMAIERCLNLLLDCGGRKDKEHPNGRPLSPKTVRHIAFVMHDCLEAAERWETWP